MKHFLRVHPVLSIFLSTRSTSFLHFTVSSAIRFQIRLIKRLAESVELIARVCAKVVEQTMHFLWLALAHAHLAHWDCFAIHSLNNILYYCKKSISIQSVIILISLNNSVNEKYEAIISEVLFGIEAIRFVHWTFLYEDTQTEICILSMYADNWQEAWLWFFLLKPLILGFDEKTRMRNWWMNLHWKIQFFPQTEICTCVVNIYLVEYGMVLMSFDSKYSLSNLSWMQTS